MAVHIRKYRVILGKTAMTNIILFFSANFPIYAKRMAKVCIYGNLWLKWKIKISTLD